MSPVVPLEILKIIKGLKNKRSVGYDDISIIVVKYVADIISTHLSYIINLSITQGIFPKKLKPVIVKPLY